MLNKWYEIASKLKREINEVMSVIDLRVYGSCARGDETADSDLDIFIEITSMTKEAKQKIREISWRLGLENETVISPLIFSRYEIEDSPLRYSPIVENILKEGISI